MGNKKPRSVAEIEKELRGVQRRLCVWLAGLVVMAVLAFSGWVK